MHEETMSWGKDETFKTTLLYDQTVLFSGLELYGILLAGISICGLMIILVPATGKITVQPIFTLNSVYNYSSHDEVRQDGQDAKDLRMVLEWVRKNFD